MRINLNSQQVAFLLQRLESEQALLVGKINAGEFATDETDSDARQREKSINEIIEALRK